MLLEVSSPGELVLLVSCQLTLVVLVELPADVVEQYGVVLVRVLEAIAIHVMCS